MANVLINGMGVLGRRLFRMIWDKELSDGLEVTMINDMFITDLEQLAYLLQYDTVYGRWKGHTVQVVDNNKLDIDGIAVDVYSKADVANLQLDTIAISFDCTGRVTDTILQAYPTAGSHVAIGVKNASTTNQCIISGINDQGYNETNGRAYSPYGDLIAITQILDIINEKYGLSNAITDEITAYTNLNNLEDSAFPAYASTSQVGRAGAWNIIPSSSSAPKMLGKIIPALTGKANGSTRNVGVITGAIMDCFVQTVNPVASADALKADIKAWLAVAGKSWQMEYADVGYVSSDMVGLPYTCFDANTGVTMIGNNFMRVSVIYDPITVAAANAVLVGAYIETNQ